MADEVKRGMTRRDFLGIATSGLGAAAGGVAASLVTRQIEKAAAVANVDVEGVTEGGQPDPTEALPADNVGASGAAPSSVADPQAADIEIEAPGEKVRYDIVDSHLHYVDFVQRSDGFPALVDAMDLAGVSQAVVFGLPIAKQWDESTDAAPGYYLSNDSRCYYYTGTDFIVAEELLAQPKKTQERFLPFCCGVNGNDRFAAEHIRQLLRLYPNFWRGIGELMSRHDDLTALTYGEPPHLDGKAFKGIYDVGAEEGLPVLVHHNIAAGYGEEVLYRAELERALAYNRDCKIIWAHVGVSRRVEIQGLTKIAAELLDAHPNLWIDISRLVYDNYLLDGFPTGHSDGDSMEDWVALIEAHPDRFMVGTDKVGHWKTYPAEVMKYYALLDELKPETARMVCRENVLGVVKTYDD
jgi:hypothetical protein